MSEVWTLGGRMEAGCLIGLLSLLAIEDMKTKQIPMVPVIICGIIGMVFHLIFQRRTIGDIVAGILIGVVLVGISILTKGKIGKGDGYLFMVTGVYLGFWKNLMLLWLACMIAGLVGLGMILFQKKNRYYQIPFVPFVLLSGFVLLLIGGGSFA
ncbi:MAG: A24 family peptidase [Lachnospiraceae bacterium]|nr:A24 family peptidase [Lachnospiraceae bacterium]